jgi:UPF0755 protein
VAKKTSKVSQTRLALLTLLIGAVLIFGGIWIIRTWYGASLKPVSTSTQTTNFTVNNGDSVHNIGVGLQKAHLIRSSKAFETYVRANPFDRNLQAGTYALSPSMSVRTIVHKIATGDVDKQLLTILPDKRLGQIKQIFLKAGYSQSEVDNAFNPANYKGHPALASLPAGATLEGYLYPESFQKQAITPATTIISQSLDEMNKRLTPELASAFKAQNLTVFQGITLASIVTQETDDPAYQPTVAQVFLKRLSLNMALGSDVTAFYASALAGQPQSVTIESPYNTRIHPGLPPGPIGNVTGSSLNSVAHPSSTDYLFFVAGDDKKLHFSKTVAEHDAAVAQYCKLGCGH